MNRVQFHTAEGGLATYTDLDALEKKTVNITENDTYEILPDEADGMSKVIVNVASSGGINVNGIIQEYVVDAGATVNAGDFVEFVTNFSTGEFNSATTSYISACRLDNNKVLLVYRDAGNNYGCSAMTISIENGIVTKSAEVCVCDHTVLCPSATVLTNDKAVVVYGLNDGENGYLV